MGNFLLLRSNFYLSKLLEIEFVDIIWRSIVSPFLHPNNLPNGASMSLQFSEIVSIQNIATETCRLDFSLVLVILYKMHFIIFVMIQVLD